MQNRKLKELKTKTREQLEKEALATRSQLAKLKAELSAGRVKNVREVKAARIHLARVMTLLNQIPVTEGVIK